MFAKHVENIANRPLYHHHEFLQINKNLGKQEIYQY
jgi:hypothetical protein